MIQRIETDNVSTYLLNLCKKQLGRIDTYPILEYAGEKMGLSLWVIDDMERVASIFSYDFLKNIVDFLVGKSKLSSREGTNYEFVGAMLLLEKLNKMNALDFSKILEEQNSQPRQQKST